jgi:hypothetical protein
VAVDKLIPTPTQRKLRIYALDPSLAAQHTTSGIGEIIISVPWEADLLPGPVGEYVEVVDADPASNCFYVPVDLNDPRLLAQDGLAPSETNPQFHQQMAYAVAMSTIGHFEQALGRVALWSEHQERNPEGGFLSEQYVRRLRIYPHALRDRNAYYSPAKKALMFGYFPAGSSDEVNTRDTLIFTVLSHDIIAHETTHALLDGVHPRFAEPVNIDVQAFHEAFADIVALFQHFSYPGVLRHQISRTRGNLEEENLLAQLAQQFGTAAGRSGALRDALGSRSETSGKWEPRKPNVRELERLREPHARGAILVAAVFGAFLKVYRSRTADLYRIASDGTGVLKAGDLHPDLSNRLADEAAKCAQHVLQMCIRAIDYCPPVGITFGDYLRALVSADYDINPQDPFGYRLAIVECFRLWGIHPPGMRSMSVEALLWPDGQTAMEEAGVPIDPKVMASLFDDEHATPKGKTATGRLKVFFWGLESDRGKTWESIGHNSEVFWSWLMRTDARKLLPALGLVVDEADIPPTVFCGGSDGKPTVEVHSVRTAVRRSPRGAMVTDLVVEITQRRRGYYDRERQVANDKPGTVPEKKIDFRYRAGCTLLIDPMTKTIRRVIRTAATVVEDGQLERVRAFLTGDATEPATSFWLARSALTAAEPFAVLHRHGDH